MTDLQENINFDDNETQKIIIEANIASQISYATVQNDIALIKSITIHNHNDYDLEDIELELSCTPEIIPFKKWIIDKIAEKSIQTIKDRLITPEITRLTHLTESITLSLTLTLKKDNEILSVLQVPIRALAKNEWGGNLYNQHLLSAFIMPNDPAVEKLLKMASDSLKKSGKKHSIEGYQENSRERVWEIASALWVAITSCGIAYAEPPAGFEEFGQKIRTPSHILDTGLATCLDSVVLFSAALEQAGLNPVVVFTEGHAFCGVWLYAHNFPDVICDDVAQVRKYVDLNELLIFETTMVTHYPPVTFKKSIDNAKAQIKEENEQKFRNVFDVKRSRSYGIKPLASITKEYNIDGLDCSVVNLAVETAPSMPSNNTYILNNNEPESENNRITLWKRKLLDLTKRNRLLNVKPSKTALFISCGDSGILEDKLASGNLICVKPKPEQQTDRDDGLYTQKNGTGLTEHYINEALERNEIIAHLTEKELKSAMIEIYRTAKNDMQEGGTNTLFLGIGILKWKQSEKEEKTYKAPLILIPITSERKSATSEIKLKKHEDDPVFNMTLLELLRRDFELEIPELHGELPTDHSGINTDLILKIVKEAVKDIKGFEVANESVLGIFSFAKYLMWKDISERTEILKKNAFVKHLIDTPKEAYAGSAHILDVSQSDKQIKAGDLFMPLEADGSQIVAVHASGQEGDFVLEGPPGTGKSQTIANMIAHNLALGNKILFVSEKMAALEVVYKRLVDKGLGSFCLELHSNRANKKEVLGQLEGAWRGNRQTISNERDKSAETLEKLKHDLNNLVTELHKKHSSGFSFWSAVGRQARYENQHLYRLNEHYFRKTNLIETPEDYMNIIDFLDNLSVLYQEIDGDSLKYLSDIRLTEWSNENQNQILKSADKIKEAFTVYKNRCSQILEKLKIDDFQPQTLEDFERFNALIKALFDLAGDRIDFIFTSTYNQNIETLEKVNILAKEYIETKSKLSASYKDDKICCIEEQIINQLEKNYQNSQNSFLSFLKNYFIKSKLNKYLSPTGQVKLSDIPLLHNAYKLSQDFNKQDKIYLPKSQQNIYTVDIQNIKNIIDKTKIIKSNLSFFKAEYKNTENLNNAIKRLVTEEQDMMTSEGAYYNHIHSFLETTEQLNQAILEYQQHTNTYLNKIDDFDAIVQNISKINDYKNHIRNYIRFNALKNEAFSLGIPNIIDDLMNDMIEPQNLTEVFQTAYACYIAPKLQDKSDILRNFSGLSHEQKIQKFRETDKRLQDISKEYIIQKLSGNIPHYDSVNVSQGYGILKRELQKKQRHKPIRQLVKEMGNDFTTLAPCILMSPISVAQFLDAQEAMFDIVIFDEASQITVWDAIGAIARAKKTIIVGDPKQMPPTNFFGRTDDGEEIDDSQSQDMESVLDEALASGVKLHRLTGHYRSKHESLITFSNHRYYNGELVTYPANDTRDSVVVFKKCNGIYKRGQGQVNTGEAKAVVAEVIRRLTDTELQKLSIGIVTMNTYQQKLIEDLLDDERRKNIDLEPYFSDTSSEPIFVKNLENVQGDQRDVIFISVGYGPDTPGAKTMSMNFGPLNRVGGERRLNVAITRATSETMIFASFDPDMIDLTRTKSDAIRDLKHYLEFAKGGTEALGRAVQSVGGVNQYDSAFEEAVAIALRKKGFTVHTQIGISKFRIDLGIPHPENLGKYIAGIECDGATYHSSPSAKDRDRVRQAILESKGWKLIRIWSTDYFNNPEATIQKVVEKLNEIIASDKTYLENVNAV